MDFNIDVRRTQLESLDQLIAESKGKVQNVLEVLNWDSTRVLKDNKFITCSLDTNHKVPQKFADNHIEKCALRKEGYDLKEAFLSEPLHHPRSAIRIDDHKKIEILSEAHKRHENFKSRWNGEDPDPKTSDRLMTTYSSDERLALYSYAVSHTKGPDKMPEYDVSQPKRDESKPLTYEEQRALERDAKRRRIKYKAVHTSRKTHTEVLREVIESQMEVYRDWVNSKVRRDDDHDTRSTSRNSSNSSRSTLKKYVKKECSDTESMSRSRTGSRDKNWEKSREKEKVTEKSEEHRRSRREDHREKEDNKSRKSGHRDSKRHERSRRSQSREIRRSGDRRNGYRDCHS